MNMIQKAIEKELSRALGLEEPIELTPQNPAKIKIKIVVLDRGWVVVGRVSYQGEWTVIEDAAVIRKWGTTRGLGEIAGNGPTEKTVLDPCPTVRARTVIMEMDCQEERWHR